MTEEEARDFFCELFKGYHHIPSSLKPTKKGKGWRVNYHEMSTYDYDLLTRLVILAHKYAYRASVSPLNFKYLEIDIFKRKRSGMMFERHPTIEEAIKTCETT